jgi:hypothetical protein
MPSAIAATAAAAVAAWLSQGALAYTGAGTERVALLPVAVGAILTCLAAGALVFWAVRRGASPAPIALLALVLFAWLPLPPALQLWAGRLVILVWIAVACAMAPAVVYGLTLPRRPQAAAAILAFLVGGVAWWQVATQVPGGDEPHYLIITQSLLKDGDVRIENNHRDRDYRSYFAGDLPPDFRVRGRDKEIYSIHAPGVSALVAPAFVAGGYYGAGLLVLALSALGTALAWHLAWIVTRREDAAWFGWAAVTLSSTWIFHSFTIYPDGPGAVLVLTGAWALLRTDAEVRNRSEAVAPWFWHGTALAMLPWMHTRFAVFAGGFGALVLLRMAAVPNAAAKAFAFLAVPAVSFLAWIAYFVAIYGTPDPSAPYGGEEGSFRFVPDGLAGLLFDQRFGLLAYAPVLVFAFAGLGIMIARPAWRRHAVELLFVLAPYLVVITYVAMWWGGRSAPARFLVPVLPWMAIPAAVAWAGMERRSTRVTALGALVFTAFASAVLVFAADGALAFNTRETYALWLEWLNGTVDLGRALPVWWRDNETPLFRGIVVWGLAGAGSWYLLRMLDVRGKLRGTTEAVVAATGIFALGAAGAASATWMLAGVSGRVATPSQLDALRTVSTERRLAAVRLPSLDRLSRDRIAPAMRISPERSTAPGGAGRNDRPLFILPAIPAGDYRVIPRLRSEAGWIMIGIGRDQFAIHTETLDAAADGLVVRFPVDVRALVVRGDEEARRSVAGLDVEPLRLVLPENRLAEEYARQAVRYAATTTFFLDANSYPEPEAFWVRGEAASQVVIQPDSPHPAETLLVRNGAATNTVLVSTNGWREEMRLGPGEERRLQVPMDEARGATLVRISTTSGFTPSATDPKSRDNRYLGVWVKVAG